MGETRIELTGWKAILVAVIILGASGYRLYTRFPPVNDEGREALRSWLVKDYTGRGPKDLARRVADYRAGLPVQPLDVPAQEPKVEFVSLSAHGWRDAMVVRSEISVDGGTPPDGQPVRYLCSDDEIRRGLDGALGKRFVQILYGVAEVRWGNSNGYSSIPLPRSERILTCDRTSVRVI
jgi:hypothetical protein